MMFGLQPSPVALHQGAEDGELEVTVRCGE